MFLQGLLIGGCIRSGGRVSDGVAIQDQLDAAVALAALRRVIGCDRLCFSKPPRGNRRYGYALFREKIAHGTGTLLGKLLVEFIAAHAVRMAFNLKVQAWMGKEDA